MLTSSFSRSRRLVAPLIAMALAIGVVACDDTEEPSDTVVDELDSEGDVPFDNDVPPGISTDTDERSNQGFESDELD
jgi:hypothetical protein